MLSKYQFDSTVVFIGFDREEQGLVGSFAYASAHQTNNIRGMISMDMIAYNPAGSLHDQALLSYGNATAPSIVAKLGNALTQYARHFAGSDPNVLGQQRSLSVLRLWI